MRNVPHIWTAWRSGVYTGDARPSTRVTVEKSYELRTTGPVVGQWKKGPARWFQRDDTTDQIETELPNVSNVATSRGIDQDAASLDLTLMNVVPPVFGQPAPDGGVGDVGHYTFDHGASQDAKARWGHAPNGWFNVLVPNALVRVYRGFGGQDLSIADAVAGGFLVLDGIFLVDDVTIGTDGMIHLKARDMAKLLIDQQIFPPLPPLNQYPLKYQRYTYKTFKIPADPKPATEHDITVAQPSDYGSCGPTPHSSGDEVAGEVNSGLWGHPPSEAFDWSYNDPPNAGPGQIAHQRTWWWSEPKAASTDTVWIEFCTGGSGVNAIYYHPWAGNYHVMVSVFENGGWVPPEGTGGGMTPEGVPYVSTFASNYEGGTPYGVDPNTYHLPRDYTPERIRLTITNLIHDNDGYRAGARKIFGLYDHSTAQYPALSFAAAGYPYNTENRTGYWQVRSNGRLHAFGDARIQVANSPIKEHRYPVIAMVAHPSGDGYWTMDYSGHVISSGTSLHFGDSASLNATDCVDLACTPSGAGYWILHKDGTVDNYGDATDYGNATVSGTMPSGADIIARSIESHPADPGYWVLLTDGTVEAFNLTNYGSANRAGFTATEYVACIRRTHDGGGYWIPSGHGIVQTFGNANWKGHAPRYPDELWVLGQCWDMIPYSESDNGYAVQYADGNLAVLGDFEYFGSIGSGEGQLRLDGNYRDYTDIVRDLLLWAGFLLKKTPQPGTEMPEVYGNLENTGAFAKDDLPQDIFDKKPILDCIRTLKEIVGYIFFIDEEGGARFESPNWWTMGNFSSTGQPIDVMPEVDEMVNLTDYSMSFTDANARSEIIIATQSPYPSLAGKPAPARVVQTHTVPPSKADLKGMVRPAMWTNGVFVDPRGQQVMADLIAMHIWFSRRTATITCVANPLIGINDQIRIYERQTGEVYVHYVRGVSINHDLTTGDFTMTLSTHWLGGSPYGRIPFFYAGDALPSGNGYWQVDANAQVYAWGAARLYVPNEADTHTQFVRCFRATPTGLGYYTMDISGKIITHGDAVHRGDLARSAGDATGLAITPSGEGYWILLTDGTVEGFGDAVNYGDATISGHMSDRSRVFAVSIESHPSIDGYWIMLTTGEVQAFNLTHHGHYTMPVRPDEKATVLRRTNTGNGYWCSSWLGNIEPHGDAIGSTDALVYPADRRTYGEVWDLIVVGDDGYAYVHTDGYIEVDGTMTDYGSHAGRGVQGRRRDWAVVTEQAYARLDDQSAYLSVSVDVMKFLAHTASPSANSAVAQGFGDDHVPTAVARVT